MTREKLLHVTVENESDDVLCPECNGKTRKEDPPHIPMPDLPENAEWLTEALGKAFCENADCPVCKEQKLVSWSYRTSGVTSHPSGRRPARLPWSGLGRPHKGEHD